MNANGTRLRTVCGVLLSAIAVPSAFCAAEQQDRPQQEGKSYRGVLGRNSKKVRTQDGKTYLWAGGDPASPDSQWYDFTEAAIPVEDLQFGIGKDRIRAIDDPLFVSPDDPRLLELQPGPYRREKRPKSTDEIMVIGYVKGEEARAYPVALLDGHELVNDRIAGERITVGW